MQNEHEIICERAANYLHQAGFSPTQAALPERVAMQREGVWASLVFQYEPALELVRLTVKFSQDKPQCGIFAKGRGELRIFVDPPALFDLLCWITSSHDDLLPRDTDTWLSQIVSLCPKTYAVLTSRNGHETLALVESTDPRQPLH